MKYVSVDEMADALLHLSDLVSAFEHEQFYQIIHTLRTDSKIGIELPACEKCAYSLRDFRGIPKYCTNSEKIESDGNEPMAICNYFKPVLSKDEVKMQ